MSSTRCTSPISSPLGPLLRAAFGNAPGGKGILGEGGSFGVACVMVWLGVVLLFGFVWQ